MEEGNCTPGLGSRKRKLEDTQVEHLPKRSANSIENEEYSKISQKMMAAMGYVPGRGIGKYGTGRAQPIEESTHKGRRGLGYLLENLEQEDVQWELEEIYYDQICEWLISSGKPALEIEDFTGWINVAERKRTIEDEVSFCDPDILKKILDGKSVFDNLSEKEFLDARMRSNPFETIKGAIFQNRAAMKMANINAVFGFMFTDPQLEPHDKIGPFDLFYFADLCAGPGGFSEYVLWKKKWHAKGFGITLKDPKSGSDFKLENFLSAPCESFDPHYGEGGYEGDGDITKQENLDAFRDYVLECTENKGVHFVMADGGISVEGQENIQEILTKQLVLCQYICGLSILRKGGNFICKVFDMFTPFSVGLFYLLYRCFERVCLFKPVTSRPANSERYVVCSNLLHGQDAVVRYLCAVNDQFIMLKEDNPHLDVLYVVPQSILDREIKFKTYVTAFNDSFGVNQITNLKKLQHFVKNTNLQDNRQSDIRKKCLQLWKIPNQPRTASPKTSHLNVFNACWEKMDKEMNLKILQTVNFVSLEDVSSLSFMEDVHSWKWYWPSGKRYMVVGLGRNDVHVWDMTNEKPSFSIRREFYGLELPEGTILEIEIVQELVGEGSGQRKKLAAYILDIISIYNERLDEKPFSERIQYAEKLCKAVNKPCRKQSITLKTKRFNRVAEFEAKFSELKLRECKGHSSPIPTYSTPDNIYFAPIGVIFIKHVKDPWHIHLSKKEHRFYFYNGSTRESTYTCPKSSVASYVDVLASRHIWRWSKSLFSDVCSSKELGNNTEGLNKRTVCEFITNALNK